MPNIIRLSARSQRGSAMTDDYKLGIIIIIVAMKENSHSGTILCTLVYAYIHLKTLSDSVFDIK